MGLFGLINAGIIPFDVGGTSAADPQMLLFQNFGNQYANAFGPVSFGTMSIHAVYIPMSISFNKLAMLLVRSASLSGNTLNFSAIFGLYSMNAGTLSLANSASANPAIASSDVTAAITRWITFATSATQNISPGQWYFGFAHVSSGVNWGISYLINNSYNPNNVPPTQFLYGRMTVSTNTPPASIATSTLDITGNDATKQQYIIITA